MTSWAAGLDRMTSLLEGSGGRPLGFDHLAEAVGEAVGCLVLVVSRRGKVLGQSERGPFDGVEAFEDPANERLWALDGTGQVDLAPDSGVAAVDRRPSGSAVTVVPVKGTGKRVGSLVLVHEAPLGDDDLVIARLGAAVAAMEILRSHVEEEDARARARTAARVAVESLSYSELEAVRAILDELGGTEGLLVASRVADREGITRSVIVNALRKLESADMIETRSLGMKGTHIRLRSPSLIDELKRLVP